MVGKNINIKFGKLGYSAFNSCVSILKNEKFRYNDTSREWIGPLYKKETIKKVLEAYDSVDDEVSIEDVESFLTAHKLQFRENPRRIPDYSLLNYGPITGKSPY